MSNYQNYVQDFPRRCQDILKSAMPKAKSQERNVTLLLMVASSALTVPYERLKEDKGHIQPINDRKRYEKATDQMDELLKKEFLSSCLQPNQSESTWACGDLKSVKGLPDAWPELQNPKPMTESETVERVLNCLRNAVAHGNLYMQHGADGEITHLVFVTGLADKNGKVISPFRFVQVSPTDFEAFLNAWLDFLGRLDLPSEVVAETLDAG